MLQIPPKCVRQRCMCIRCTCIVFRGILWRNQFYPLTLSRPPSHTRVGRCQDRLELSSHAYSLTNTRKSKVLQHPLSCVELGMARNASGMYAEALNRLGEAILQVDQAGRRSANRVSGTNTLDMVTGSAI